MDHSIRARYGLYKWCIAYGPYHMVYTTWLRLRYTLEITHTVLTHDENAFIFCKTRVSKEYSAVFFVQNFILSCNSIKFSNKTFFIMIFICIQPKSVSNRNDHAFNEWTRSGTHDWLIEFFGRFRIKRFAVNF